MKFFQVLCLVLLVSTGTMASADTGVMPLDQAQQTFFNRFRTAVRGGDTRLLIELTHTKSLACIKEGDRQYYYSTILHGLTRLLGKNQIIDYLGVRKVTSEDLRKDSTNVFTGKAVSWPVTPQEQLIIRYIDEGVENTTSLYITRENKNWKWVHACPK